MKAAKVISMLLCVVMLAGILPTGLFATGEYTVIFNVNGGTNGPDKLKGAEVVIPSEGPQKADMVFRGWSLSAYDAAVGNIEYTAGDTLTISGDVILYASYAYTVTLKCGNEGSGNSDYVLYKFPAKELSLCHDKASIKASYGMYPKNNDQRSFIQWNTAQNSTTSKGTGRAYYYGYTENANVTLYAIWGYAIQYNADGGIFPANASTVFSTYVCDCDDVNYQNPKTLYGNFDFPDGDNLPTKDGCRLYTNNGQVFYGLLYSNMNFFTTESAQQNLTIPPTGGKMPWSTFHCSVTDYGLDCPEFYAIWEPSFTYNANGGEGEDIVEYLSWDWGDPYNYEPYKIRKNSFTKEGAAFEGWNTMPDGSGQNYTAGTTRRSFKNSDPVVLYAQWSDGSYAEHLTEKKVVSYDANGGKNAPAPQNKYWGSVLTITEDVPTREGYIFLGWGASRTAAHVDYTPGSLYGVDNSQRLYAIWQECTDHSFEIISQTEGTDCTEAGLTVKKCSCCSVSYDEYIYGEHLFVNYISDGNSSCVDLGTKTAKCECCDATDTIPGELTPHAPGDWYTTLEPTYTAEGHRTRYCAVCSAELQRLPIPMLIMTLPFEDVKEGKWFYDAVYYCYVRGYVSGMSETSFAPNAQLTREQFLLLLAKLDGATLTDYAEKKTPFADVKEGAWYENAVNWAYAEGYTGGMSEDRFGIGENITREQLARFFYTYAESKGADVSQRAELSVFEDAKGISYWAKENVEWAVSVGLISGMTETTLVPRGNATRAQAAQMLKSFDLMYN